MKKDVAPCRVNVAARMLKRMVQNGVLIRIGEGKNTRYMLAKT